MLRRPTNRKTPLMTRLLTYSVVVLFMLGGTASARAEIIFTATLTHDQETSQGILVTSTGDPRPLSSGTATFVLNDAQTALTMNATIFDIDVTGTQTADTNDNLVAAHIHAGPTAVPGSNAGVVWGFFGAPDNDNAPSDLILTPFASEVGGTFFSVWNLNEGNAGTTLTAQIPNLLAGLSYINFHTVQFGGGEIRGALVAVPEPGTLVLFGIALAGLCFRRRPRR